MRKNSSVSKPWSEICEITKIDNLETILLLGDSHADSVKLALQKYHKIIFQHHFTHQIMFSK